MEIQIITDEVFYVSALKRGMLLCITFVYMYKQKYLFSDVFFVVNFRWFSDGFPCSSEKELLLLWLLSKAGETDVVGKVLLRDKYCARFPDVGENSTHKINIAPASLMMVKIANIRPRNRKLYEPKENLLILSIDWRMVNASR